MRILISGGGTGGHIYPALAVADELRERYDADLLYIGDENGLETRIIPDTGIPFATISAGKLRRYLSARTFTDLARIPRGMSQAYRHAREFQPDAAFTSGGYVAAPAGIAARLCGAPLVMHQQDVPPNLANRLLKPFATCVTVSFAASLSYFPADKTILTGNPVREEVLRAARLDAAQARASFGFASSAPVVLVTGGSQGARRLNQAVTAALPTLLQYCQVLHVSGEQTYEETYERAERALSALPERMSERYRLFRYLKTRMPDAIAACDVAFCRSGAATLAELATIGRASVLVPLPPGFSGSPQTDNATMFQQAGAAEIVLDHDLTPHAVMEALMPMLGDANRIVQMAVAAHKLARPTATRDLADIVASLVKRQERRPERRPADGRERDRGPGRGRDR